MTSHQKSLRRRILESVFDSVDFKIACFSGAMSVLASLRSERFHEALIDLMPVMVGVFATLIGFVIAGQSLAFALISPELRLVLDLAPDGLRGVARPYKIVAGLSFLALIIAIWLYLTSDVPAPWPWVVHAESGLFMLFGIWALAGATQLVWNGTTLLDWNHTIAKNVETIRRSQAS